MEMLYKMTPKIDMPSSVTPSNQTPTTVGCGSKKPYKNEMCIKDMTLSAQNMITRLNSQQNWGGTYTTI